MTGLLWDDVKDLFDPHTMGSLPNLRVPDTAVDHWQALLELIVERGWRHRYREGGAVVPLPRARVVLSGLGHAKCPEWRVWPSGAVLAIFRFHDPGEIDFDADLRELQGQERLDILCGFLAAIGRGSGKPVLMGPEGDHGHPVLGFDVRSGRVVRLAEPR